MACIRYVVIMDMCSFDGDYAQLLGSEDDIV